MNLVFTCKENDEIIASLELMQGVDEAEILDVQTLPSHRRQGLAQSLLQEAFDWARQNERNAIWLEVRTGNAGAIALYEKMGFVPISRRMQYYTDGEDAIVMKYTL